MQVLPRHHLDEHHVPGQQHGSSDALPMPAQLGGLPGEEASLPDGRWPWLSVQLCLLATDGEFFLPLIGPAPKTGLPCADKIHLFVKVTLNLSFFSFDQLRSKN